MAVTAKVKFSMVNGEVYETKMIEREIYILEDSVRFKVLGKVPFYIGKGVYLLPSHVIAYQITKECNNG